MPLHLRTHALNRFPLRTAQIIQVRRARRICHQIQLRLNTSSVSSLSVQFSLTRTGRLHLRRLSLGQGIDPIRRRTSMIRRLARLSTSRRPLRSRNISPDDTLTRRLRDRTRRRCLLTCIRSLRQRCRYRSHRTHRPTLQHQISNQTSQRDSQARINPPNTRSLPAPSRSAPPRHRLRRGVPHRRRIVTTRAGSHIRLRRIPVIHRRTRLQHTIGIVYLTQLVFRLLPQPGIASKAIRMPHLHQIAIRFFDLGGSSAGLQRQNIQCFLRQQGPPSSFRSQTLTRQIDTSDSAHRIIPFRPSTTVALQPPYFREDPPKIDPSTPRIICRPTVLPKMAKFVLRVQLSSHSFERHHCPPQT